MRRAATLTCATAAIVVATGGSAAAAPAEQQVVPLVCDDGNTYTGVVAGNGDFTPARLAEGGVLVPTAFGEVTFTAVLPDGTVIEDSAPPMAKGGGNVRTPPALTSVTCTFSVEQTLTEDENDLPAGTQLTFAGSVSGFITGPR